jgi:hypothetical protein
MGTVAVGLHAVGAVAKLDGERARPRSNVFFEDVVITIFAA